MTESTGPAGGWAGEPRGPLSTVLDAGVARQLARQAARVGQGRPALVRALAGVLIGLLVAWSSGPVAGLVAGAGAVLLLVGFPLALVAARARAQVSAGDLRTTGYDHDGRFVWEGSTRRTHPAGWARSVERDGDLWVLRPRAARVQPTLVPSGLLTDDDVAFLTREVTEQVVLPHSVVVTPAVRRGMRRTLLRNLLTPTVLVLAVVLFVAEVLITSGAPWPWPLVYAAGATILTLVLAAGLLVVLARVGLRNGRVLRSGEVGESLRLDGSHLLPGELPFHLLRSGTPAGSVVRVRHGLRWVGVPLELVPADARPPVVS